MEPPRTVEFQVEPPEVSMNVFCTRVTKYQHFRVHDFQRLATFALKPQRESKLDSLGPSRNTKMNENARKIKQIRTV